MTQVGNPRRVSHEGADDGGATVEFFGSQRHTTHRLRHFPKKWEPAACLAWGSRRRGTPRQVSSVDPAAPPHEANLLNLQIHRCLAV